MTENTLMQRDGFKLTLNEDNDTFRLYDTETDDEGLIWGEDPIFETADFRPGAMHSIDSDASVGSVLTFFSLQAGDTDSEYFEDYTERQIDWRDSRAEDLGSIAFEIGEAVSGSPHCAAHCNNDQSPYDEALLFGLSDDGSLDTVVTVYDCLTGKLQDIRISSESVDRTEDGEITPEGWEWIRDETEAWQWREEHFNA